MNEWIPVVGYADKTCFCRPGHIYIYYLCYDNIMYYITSNVIQYVRIIIRMLIVLVVG